jgi:hypothetical protein
VTAGRNLYLFARYAPHRTNPIAVVNPGVRNQSSQHVSYYRHAATVPPTENFTLYNNDISITHGGSVWGGQV